MIGVVGGGVAGLAAARRLQKAGYDVMVLEASDDLGGLAATYETKGDPIERYYHHLSKSEETIVERFEELGLGSDLVWGYGSDAYYVDGVVHPMDKPWEILAYPHLSLYDKFRLGLLVLDVDIRGGSPPLTPTSNSKTSRTFQSRSLSSITRLGAVSSGFSSRCSRRSSASAGKTSAPRGSSAA